MRSVQAEPARSPSDGDLTARARIRDAAITRIAADGVAAASVRAIAAEAGVSPGLVIHHFGSKDGLRAACDEHVSELISENKHAAMAAGPGLDPVAALRQAAQGPPLLGYLARSLVDGSPRVARLVDDMVNDAEDYLAEGVRTGALKPTSDPYGRAVLLVVWNLGALVLHDHVERLLDIRLAENLVDQPNASAYFGPALELFADGLVTDAMAAQLKQVFAAHEAAKPRAATKPPAAAKKREEKDRD